MLSHPISKAGRSFRVTGCRPNARISGMNVGRSGMTASRCEKTLKRLGVREMAPGETFQKVPETCLQPKTAYRLGFVVPGDMVKWFHLQSKPLKLLINLRLGKGWRRRCGTQLQVKGQERTTCFAEKISPKVKFKTLNVECNMSSGRTRSMEPQTTSWQMTAPVGKDTMQEVHCVYTCAFDYDYTPNR